MTRQTTTPLAGLAAAVAIALSTPVGALAHHSHAMFDDSREVTITGTVAAFRFHNPHVYVLIEVTGEDGSLARWAIEMSTVQNMIRRGIDANTFQVGTQAVIRVNPLRNGQSGGNYTRIVSLGAVANTADDDSWAPPE